MGWLYQVQLPGHLGDSTLCRNTSCQLSNATVVPIFSSSKMAISVALSQVANNVPKPIKTANWKMEEVIFLCK